MSDVPPTGPDPWAGVPAAPAQQWMSISLRDRPGSLQRALSDAEWASAVPSAQFPVTSPSAEPANGNDAEAGVPTAPAQGNATLNSHAAVDPVNLKGAQTETESGTQGSDPPAVAAWESDSAAAAPPAVAAWKSDSAAAAPPAVAAWGPDSAAASTPAPQKPSVPGPTPLAIPANLKGDQTETHHLEEFSYSAGMQFSTKEEANLKSDMTKKGYKPKPKPERPPPPVKLMPGGRGSKEQGTADPSAEDTMLAVNRLAWMTGEEYILEDQFQFTVLPSAITQRCQIHGQDGTKLYKGDFAMIQFHVSSHISSLQLILGKQDAVNPDKSVFKSVLRFPSHAIAQMDFSITKEHTNYLEKDAANRCFIISLRYHLHHVVSENVFVQKPHELIQDLVTYMQTDGDLFIHVCASEAAAGNYKALLDQINEDRSKNPLDVWIPKDQTMFMVQRNEFLKPDERPVVPDYQVKSSFFSFDEFVIVNCIGPLEEQEKEEEAYTKWRMTNYQAYFCKIAGGADRIYLALLDLPTSENVRLQPDTVVKILPAGTDPHEDVTDKWTHTIVAKPIPNLPGCLLPLYMSRKWNKEEKKFIGWEDTNFIEIKVQDELLRQVEALRKEKPTPITIKIPIDIIQYKNRVTGFAKLVEYFKKNETDKDAVDLKRLLIGNDSTKVAGCNVYHSIGFDPKEVMGNMNAGQSDVVELALNAPAGIVNVHGPPGTGKTHTCGELGRPFIIADNGIILATSASNISTDALAARFHGIILESGKPGQYCLRVHSTGTEADIVRQKARLVQPAKPDAKPKSMQEVTEEEQELLDSIRFANVIHEGYAQQHTYANEMVPDHRVTEFTFKMSIGRRILQLIGEIPSEAGDPTPEPKAWVELRELYRKYKLDELDEETMKLFKAELTTAREQVLERATVICTTPSIAVQPKVYTPIQSQVQLIILDEASRVLECDALAMLGHYHDYHGFVMVGDPNQLPPTVMHSHRFSKQMEMSLQARLLANGTASAFLSEQYRMSPKISGPLNRIAYRERLTDHPSVADRPILKEIQSFNLDAFKTERYNLSLDVRAALVVSMDGGSRYCVDMACASINIAEKFMKAFPNLSIAIICFYNAQFLIYTAMRDAMIVKNREGARLAIVKADSVQGLEFDCTIVDVTVGGYGGFLNSINRLIVAISRAKYATYFVMSKSAIARSKSRALSRVAMEYLNLGKPLIIEPLDDLRSSDYFDNRMLEFSAAAVVEAVGNAGDENTLGGTEQGSGTATGDDYLDREVEQEFSDSDDDDEAAIANEMW